MVRFQPPGANTPEWATFKSARHGGKDGAEAMAMETAQGIIDGKTVHQARQEVLERHNLRAHSAPADRSVHVSSVGMRAARYGRSVSCLLMGRRHRRCFRSRRMAPRMRRRAKRSTPCKSSSTKECLCMRAGSMRRRARFASLGDAGPATGAPSRIPLYRCTTTSNGTTPTKVGRCSSKADAVQSPDTQHLASDSTAATKRP